MNKAPAPHHMHGSLTAQAMQARAQSMMKHQSVIQFKQNRYMIDGVIMDFDTFINTLYPEDCAEKTFMILKLTKE